MCNVQTYFNKMKTEQNRTCFMATAEDGSDVNEVKLILYHLSSLFYTQSICKSFEYRSKAWWKFCNTLWGKSSYLFSNKKSNLEVNHIQLEASRGQSIQQRRRQNASLWKVHTAGLCGMLHCKQHNLTKFRFNS